MSFWANKLNGTPAPAQAPSRDLYGLYTTQAPVTQQQSIQQPQAAQGQYVPTARLKQGGRCPGCSSDKYMQHGSYAVACAECGYHPRFEQTGYGLPSLASPNGQPAAAARQTGESSSLKASIAQLNAGQGQHITAL